MQKSRVWIPFVVFVLAVITLACGSSPSVQKIGEATKIEGSETQVSTPKTYKVGDIIKIDDYTLVLDNAQVQGSQLIASFTVDNSHGAKTQNFSSLLGFNAKDEDGNKLQFSMCSGSGLDGEVMAGDKLKGNVCWDGVKQGKKIKIYYQSSLLGGSDVVWEVAQ